MEYIVKCYHCGEKFDLIKAKWCIHGVSKVCPHCGRCICDLIRSGRVIPVKAPEHLYRFGITILFRDKVEVWNEVLGELEEAKRLAKKILEILNELHSNLTQLVNDAKRRYSSTR